MQPIKLAIVHYHLKRGGVTRVIESTIEAARKHAPELAFTVISGQNSNAFSPNIACYEVPALNYASKRSCSTSAEQLVEQLKAAAIQGLGSLPDVWHIHNHSLGKIPAFESAVHQLAQESARILLQIHDFAEDGRPKNYTQLQDKNKLYPLAPGIQYAVINSRDQQQLQKAGFPDEQLKLLANPVTAPTNTTVPIQAQKQLLSQLNAERLIVYPVRALRRKNLGEFLLWAALAEPGEVFAMTLGPTNEAYRARYQAWKALSQELALPVHWEIGESTNASFECIMQSASAILNTSIAEGFGLTFLEPWLFAKGLLGRKLPDITADFKAKGIDLSNLYTALPIPKAYVCLSDLEHAIAKGLQQAYASYQRALPQDAVERALQAIHCGPDHIDFGGLDEAQQTAIIRQVQQDPSIKNLLKPHLSIKLASTEHIEKNAAAVKTYYNEKTYIQELQSIYQQALGHSNSASEYCLKSLPTANVLSRFLKPENFRLLRT